MPLKPITEDVPDEQTDLAPRRTHERDEDQITIDGWTTKLVKEWEDSGQPGEDGYAGPSRRFATDDSPDAKRRVARAFALVNHDRTDSKPKLAALWFKNSKPDGDGFITVKYGVRVQPAKEAAAEQPNAEQPNAEQPDAEQPPFDGDQPSGEQPSGDDTGRGFRRGGRR